MRNRSLTAAATLGADWIALIDDDEVPDRDWLRSLLDTARRTGAPACVGPVVPLFDRVPPAWATTGGFFAKTLPVRDGLVADAYTANALLDLRVVTALGLSFDMRFNTLGGEDTIFFRSLLLAGHRIAWAPDAIVYDSIPAHRMRVRWLLARWYRSGSVEAYLGRLRPETVSGGSATRPGPGPASAGRASSRDRRAVAPARHPGRRLLHPVPGRRAARRRARPELPGIPSLPAPVSTGFQGVRPFGGVMGRHVEGARGGVERRRGRSRLHHARLRHVPRVTPSRHAPRVTPSRHAPRVTPLASRPSRHAPRVAPRVMPPRVVPPRVVPARNRSAMQRV
ncbi:glycosyltransferase family 2 protein [Methylobacterium sp. WL1]|uniref:glycosyltransferase family 2 protein n=1 Tax=Methylobacterium sp. WL1 TaxID=2603276 RepID=UPI001FED6AF8|nr:glycosyltransferase family 2 protein [Methylobacterium sp. WL1]